MIWKLLIGSHGATWHSKELGWLGLVKTTKSALLGVRTLSGTWSARTTAGGVGRGEVLAAVRPARHIRYAACRGWTGPRTRSTLPHDTGRLDSCAWQCCGVAHVMCAGTSSSNDTYAAATAGFASPDAFRGGSGGTGDPSAHVVRGTSPGRPEPRPQQKPAASLAPGAGDKPPKNFPEWGHLVDAYNWVLLGGEPRVSKILSQLYWEHTRDKLYIPVGLGKIRSKLAFSAEKVFNPLGREAQCRRGTTPVQDRRRRHRCRGGDLEMAWRMGWTRGPDAGAEHRADAGEGGQ